MSTDALGTKLTLTVKGQKFVVPAGNLKRFAFDWDIRGFSASAEWWLVSLRSTDEDPLLDSFATDDLMEAELSIEHAFDLPGDTSTPIVLTGLVVDKWVEERAFSDIADAPVLLRHYGLRFRDRLSVLWGQHYPCLLYAQTSLKDVLDDNLPQGVTLTCSWPALAATCPVVSVGLGRDERPASFYDFVLWLADSEHGFFSYDAGKDTYELAATRTAATSQGEIGFADVAQVRSIFPEVSRAVPSVLNASTLAATKQKPLDNAQAVSGVEAHFLIRSSLSSELDKRVELEVLRHKPKKPQLQVVLARYPRSSLWPGTEHTWPKPWSSNLYFSENTHWVRAMSMEARAVSEEAVTNLEDTQNTYETEISLSFEDTSDEAPRRAHRSTPPFPMHVEGIVVSDVGEEDQGTYQIKIDQETSLDYYRIKVPLFQDLEIIATFDAGFAPGHFYFPAFRGQRVVVELQLRSARIVRFVDFRPDARLPADTQGNHLLLGKKIADGTSVKHYYRSQKPVLDIRRLADKDCQLISASDGTILLKTEELSDS